MTLAWALLAFVTSCLFIDSGARSYVKHEQNPREWREDWARAAERQSRENENYAKFEMWKRR